MHQHHTTQKRCYTECSRIADKTQTEPRRHQALWGRWGRPQPMRMGWRNIQVAFRVIGQSNGAPMTAILVDFSQNCSRNYSHIPFSFNARQKRESGKLVCGFGDSSMTAVVVRLANLHPVGWCDGSAMPTHCSRIVDLCCRPFDLNKNMHTNTRNYAYARYVAILSLLSILYNILASILADILALFVLFCNGNGNTHTKRAFVAALDAAFHFTHKPTNTNIKLYKLYI